MCMENFKKFVFEDEHLKNPHGIYDRGLISDKEDNLPNGTEIYLCPEKNGIGTENPHFHIKIDNKYEFEIQFEHLHDLEIWRSTTDKLNWSGYEHVRDAIKEWLERTNYNQNRNTNIEVILSQWNRENYNDKIDKNRYMQIYQISKNRV